MNNHATADGRFAVLGDTDAQRYGRDLVGAKANNLMRMVRAGLPVPPGFVIGTSVCAEYHAGGGRLPPYLDDLLADGVHEIERATGRRFGAQRRPLLLAVRSGAPASMPGMLDTVLDIGLCDATLPQLLRATGDPVFVWDSYRRLIQSYAEVVDQCPPASFAAVLDDATHREGVPSVSELDAEALRGVVQRFKASYRSATANAFPQDPVRQLRGAVEAVLRSWNADRAVTYRRREGLTDLVGTAVTVQAMVFGNLGTDSGAGVGFTRDPATGANRLYVDFLLDAQGEDVVAGRHRATNADALIGAVPGLAQKLQSTRRTLEELFHDAQDFEFTVEEGRLWLLQTRDAKRTPWAALQIVCDLVDEGLIEPATALERLAPYHLDDISRDRLAVETTVEPLAAGVPASTGVTVGRIACSAERARSYAEAGDAVILVRHDASTDDIAALTCCRGLLTATGTRTSHAAVVARHLGLVCVVGCADLALDADDGRLRLGDRTLNEGATITLDGTTGQIYGDALQTREERPLELLARVRSWSRRAEQLISS
jgi:pyruvate,orthophosphate dikinase